MFLLVNLSHQSSSVVDRILVACGYFRRKHSFIGRIILTVRDGDHETLNDLHVWHLLVRLSKLRITRVDSGTIPSPTLILTLWLLAFLNPIRAQPWVLQDGNSGKLLWPSVVVGEKITRWDKKAHSECRQSDRRDIKKTCLRLHQWVEWAIACFFCLPFDNDVEGDCSAIANQEE